MIIMGSFTLFLISEKKLIFIMKYVVWFFFKGPLPDKGDFVFFLVYQEF